MRIEHLNPKMMLRLYDIRCQPVLAHHGGAKPPFGAAWALVKPGECTRQHAHSDREVFVIINGRGRVTVGDESTEVSPGMALHFSPFQQHRLENTAPDEDLVFLSLSWEDREAWLPTVTPTKPAVGRVLVTAAPPTPNGDLHLGHLSGPYLAADMQRRYLDACGVDSLYACGTDDSQSYVSTRAAALGQSPGEVADGLSRKIVDTLELASARPDIFLRPGDYSGKDSLLSDVFLRLVREGHVVPTRADHPFCATCDRFLFEAFISGSCPHCGAPSGGGGCEGCGLPNDSVDMKDPRCTGCGAPPTTRPLTRLVFPLRNFATRLREFHSTVAMPARIRSLCASIIDDLPSIAVAHPATWGVEVPLNGFEQHRFLGWFEMAGRYLAYADRAAAEMGLPGGWEAFWKHNDARVVQCFGFDNAFFYAIFIPALLLAYDPDIRLPSAFIANEFYRLDGQKFSTSRNHAIWVREMVQKVSPDALRFFLAYTCPEASETNFTHEDFRRTTERELGAQGLTGWLEELADRVAGTPDGRAPSNGDWTDEHRHFYSRLVSLTAEAADAYEAAHFSPQRATRVLSSLIGEARRFGRRQRHWATLPRTEERRTALALELLAAKTLAVIASPLMPDFSSALWRALGYDSASTPLRWERQPEWVPTGQSIGDLRAVAGAVLRDDTEAVLAKSPPARPREEAQVAD